MVIETWFLIALASVAAISAALIVLGLGVLYATPRSQPRAKPQGVAEPTPLPVSSAVDDEPATQKQAA